jgi:organic hydroperoxide reductase OsmC/OhrA
MFSYPMVFGTSVTASDDSRLPWPATASGHDVLVNIPPEFNGPGGALSPEDLYALALTNCFVATFKVFAANSKMSFQSMDVKDQLTVDLDESKKPSMHAFHFDINLQAPNDPDRARRLVEKTINSGFILTSVKTAISYQLEII